MARIPSNISKRSYATETDETTPNEGEGTKNSPTEGRLRAHNTHLSKRSLANHLDRPEIPQADLSPTQPQKLRLRARMSPNLSHPAVLLHARERSLELRTPTARSPNVSDTPRLDTHDTHRTFKSIAVSSARR